MNELGHKLSAIGEGILVKQSEEYGTHMFEIYPRHSTSNNCWISVKS